MQAKGRLQCWNADGQELGGSCRAHLKPARKSSTPAVVPGAAPALAKAGVGGYLLISIDIFRVPRRTSFQRVTSPEPAQ